MRRRRNSDWDDLPPMFAPAPAPAPRDEWESLPPMLPPQPSSQTTQIVLRTPDQPSREIAIRLDPQFSWLRSELIHALDVLEQSDVGTLVAASRFADERGDFFLFRDMDAVCRVRHAVWKLAGDPTKDFKDRVQALRIEKAMDSATQGRSAACLDQIVRGLHRVSGVSTRSLTHRGSHRGAFILGPREELAGLEQVIGNLSDVYKARFESAWDSYDWNSDERIFDNDCTDCVRGRCQHIEEARTDYAVGEAMFAVAEELVKAGAEAKVIGDPQDIECPYKVWFRRPRAGSSIYWQVWVDYRGDVSIDAMTDVYEDLFQSVMEDGWIGNPPRKGSRS